MLKIFLISIIILLYSSENLSSKIQVGQFTEQIYEGIWNSSQNQNYINSQKGQITIQLVFFPTQKENSLYFLFLFKKNKYLDDPQIFGETKLKIIDEQQNELFGETKGNFEKITKIFYSKGILKDCKIESKISLQKKNGEKLTIKTNEKKDIKITGIIKSTNCHINLKFEVFSQPYYIFSIIIFTFLQIIFIILGFYPFYNAVRIHDFSKIKNLSQLAFFFNIILDILLCTVNIIFAMRILIDYFEFLVLLMLFFLTSILFKVRILLEIFERNLIEQNFNQRNLARSKFIFLIKFVIGIVLAIILSNLFIVDYYLFFIVFLYPIFQIYHNCFKIVQKHCFYFKLHFLIFFSQIFYPVILRSEIFPFFAFKRDLLFIIILVSFNLFLIFVMILQKYISRTFFLPNFLIPNYYNYYKKISNLKNNDEKNCPICFCDLEENPDDTSNKSKLFFKKFMKTPCGHNFHVKCLKQWMDTKLLCPNCRTVLPPY